MRRHPEMGVKIVGSIDRFAPAIPYIISHHEWYDGSGYPEGLAGEDIPVEGRLLAVVDTVDAILSDRPYRPGATLKKAMDELRAFSGSQFDPEIVASLLELIESGTVDLSAMYSLGAEGGPAHRASEKARA
jgi:HD-GYP domain-containing protein (c-di-GMP phosphodiesterase class II)